MKKILQKKVILAAIIPTLILVYFIFRTVSSSSAQEFSPGSHHVGKVSKGDIKVVATADGQLFSETSKAIIIERIRWYWDYTVSWVAKEGTVVKAGDVVIKLDPSVIQKDLVELQSNKARAKLGLEEEEMSALDQVSDAEATYKASELELKKAKLMAVDNDSVSAIEKKKGLLGIVSAEAELTRNKEKIKAIKQSTAQRIELKKLELKRAATELEEIEAGMEKLNLKAPQDGLLIFDQYADNSGVIQKAAPGATVRVNTAVAEIADTRNLLAKVFVLEMDAAGINESTPVTVAFDVLSGKEFTGKIVKIGKIASTPAERDGSRSTEPAKNIKQIEVWIKVDALPPNVVPGLSVQAVFHLVNKQNVLRLPIEFVIEGNKNLQQTCVFDKRKRSWHLQDLSLGAASYSHVEVLRGLDDGDEVKTSCDK